MNFVIWRRGAPIHPKMRIAEGALGEVCTVGEKTYNVDVSLQRRVDPFWEELEGMYDMELFRSERRAVASFIAHTGSQGSHTSRPRLIYVYAFTFPSPVPAFPPFPTDQ